MRQDGNLESDGIEEEMTPRQARRRRGAVEGEVTTQDIRRYEIAATKRPRTARGQTESDGDSEGCGDSGLFDEHGGGEWRCRWDSPEPASAGFRRAGEVACGLSKGGVQDF